MTVLIRSGGKQKALSLLQLVHTFNFWYLCGDIIALCDSFWGTLLLFHLHALLSFDIFAHLFGRLRVNMAKQEK